ncbi:SRPBCC family protein [soil metagenome]
MTVPPEAAWRVLTDLHAWPQWGPSVQRAELAEAGPLRLGSRGTVWAAIGVPLPFEVTEYDAGCSWAWKIAGIAGTRHIVAAHNGGCRVSFGVPVWVPIYLTVCPLALKRIEELARSQV